MRYTIADAHTDYLSWVNRDARYINANMANANHISKDGLQKGGVGLQIFAAFTDSAKSDPMTGAMEQISAFYRVKEAWGNVDLLDASKDVIDIENGMLYGVLAIEGGEALKGSEKVFDSFHRLGVRAITLTWNYENEIGYPACSGSKQGLKPFGKRMVKLMNDYGVAVDVSHLNVNGFWNAIETSAKPIMASHSNVHKLCPHSRNLTDDQIKAIIETNGYIGMNFYTEFLTENDESHLSDIVNHAHYILELGGENVLGFGSDFDGITSMPGEIQGAQHFQMVMQALAGSGIDDKTLNKIANGNLLRYLKVVLT